MVNDVELDEQGRVRSVGNLVQQDPEHRPTLMPEGIRTAIESLRNDAGSGLWRKSTAVTAAALHAAADFLAFKFLPAPPKACGCPGWMMCECGVLGETERAKTDELAARKRLGELLAKSPSEWWLNENRDSGLWCVGIEADDIQSIEYGETIAEAINRALVRYAAAALERGKRAPSGEATPSLSDSAPSPRSR